MVPGHDKASVLVSGGICPREESDMEEIYVRLLEHDPDDAELEVRFRNDKIEWNFMASQKPECLHCVDCT